MSTYDSKKLVNIKIGKLKYTVIDCGEKISTRMSIFKNKIEDIKIKKRRKFKKKISF